MDTANTMEQNTQQQSGDGNAFESTVKRAPEFYSNARRAVGDAYSKTTRMASQAYTQSKAYSMDNPGKAILMAMGIGVGIGFLLAANSRRSRVDRIGRPVIDALASIGREFFR